MRSYKPEELFDANGGAGARNSGTWPRRARSGWGPTPYANGGVLRRALRMPDFRQYGVEVTAARTQ